jgi:hypothetical protein
MEALLRKLNEENVVLRQLVSSAEHGWREALLIVSTLKGAAAHHHKALMHLPEENVDTLEGAMRLKALQNEVGLYQRRFNTYMRKEGDFHESLMNKVVTFRRVLGLGASAQGNLSESMNRDSTFDAGDVDVYQCRCLDEMDALLASVKDMVASGMSMHELAAKQQGDEENGGGESYSPAMEILAADAPPPPPPCTAGPEQYGDYWNEKELLNSAHRGEEAASMRLVSDCDGDSTPAKVEEDGNPPLDLDETLSEDGGMVRFEVTRSPEEVAGGDEVKDDTCTHMSDGAVLDAAPLIHKIGDDVEAAVTVTGDSTKGMLKKKGTVKAKPTKVPSSRGTTAPSKAATRKVGPPKKVTGKIVSTLITVVAKTAAKSSIVSKTKSASSSSPITGTIAKKVMTAPKGRTGPKPASDAAAVGKRPASAIKAPPVSTKAVPANRKAITKTKTTTRK